MGSQGRPARRLRGVVLCLWAGLSPLAIARFAGAAPSQGEIDDVIRRGQADALPDFEAAQRLRQDKTWTAKLIDQATTFDQRADAALARWYSPSRSEELWQSAYALRCKADAVWYLVFASSLDADPWQAYGKPIVEQAQHVSSFVDFRITIARDDRPTSDLDEGARRILAGQVQFDAVPVHPVAKVPPLPAAVSPEDARTADCLVSIANDPHWLNEKSRPLDVQNRAHALGYSSECLYTIGRGLEQSTGHRLLQTTPKGQEAAWHLWMMARNLTTAALAQWEAALLGNELGRRMERNTQLAVQNGINRVVEAHTRFREHQRLFAAKGG